MTNLDSQRKDNELKILSLLGSPRKKGNTATVLKWVEEGLENSGQIVERINVANKKINGCLGCEKCKSVMHKPGCVQNDDAIEIIEKMTLSDAVIYASPVYYWGFSAQLKALIDRCYSLYRGECRKPGHVSFVEGQKTGLVVTCADPFENNAELLISAFTRILIYDKASSAGELIVSNCTTPDKLGNEIRLNAQRYANQFLEGSTEPYALMMPGGGFVPTV